MKYPLPPLNALRVFEAVSRLGSFARAADELNMTPSAVSHSIKSLERFHGSKLVSRSRSGVSLTRAGEKLIGAVRDALVSLSEASSSARARDPKRLSLTIPPSLASRWLLPRLGQFLDDHPDIAFQIHTTTSLVDLAAEDIDCAIRYGDGHWRGVTARKLFDETVFPVAAPRYAARLNLRGAKDLRRARLLCEDSQPWQSWLKSAGLDDDALRFGPSFTDSALLLQAAEAGHGVALGRSVLVGDALAAGALVRLGPVFVRAAGSYYFVTPSLRDASPLARKFRQWLVSLKT